METSQHLDLIRETLQEFFQTVQGWKEFPFLENSFVRKFYQSTFEIRELGGRRKNKILTNFSISSNSNS